MTTAPLIVAFLAAATALAPQMAASQPPSIANGTVTRQNAAAPFPESFRSLVSSQADTAWIGYTVPVVDRELLLCCDGWSNGGQQTSSAGCRIEPSSKGDAASERPSPGSGASAPVQLEGSDRILVLFRVVERSVERIRVVAGDCPLDAGGRPVRWIDGVRPADSLAVLERLALDTGPGRRVPEGAIMAIAWHADPGADLALDRLSARGQPEAVRKAVPFWLGQVRGRRGFDALSKIIREDPSVEVRKSAVFGLSQSRVPGTVDALVAIARTDAEPRLRGEALFWLAHKAGRQASAAITDRIDQDPDTDVKRKAVFALSQLPKDEGIPLLINVARTHTNPAVRKQAMFWLGQSKDPRALDFFTQVLK